MMYKNIIVSSLFILTTFSVQAYSTKYNSRCPGNQNYDLHENFGPIRSQAQAPWCATFTATALVEHFIKKETGVSRQLSRTDANSIMSTRPLDNKGMPIRDIDLAEGSNSLNILEGIQNVGGLYDRSELPFDSALFGHNKLLEKLQDYYAQTESNDCIDCLDLAVQGGPLDSTNAKNQLSNIRRLSHSLDEFLNKVNKDLGNQIYRLLPLNSNATRVPVPPYNVKRNSHANGDQYIEGLVNSLKNGRPQIASVCYNKLHRNITGQHIGSDCGDHAMVMVGSRTHNGTCQVLLRNSHGRSWPSSSNADPGGGYQWVNVNDFLGAVRKQDNNTSITVEITKRAPPIDQVKNDIPLLDGSRYVGRTWQGKLEGSGSLYSPDGSLEGQGRFENGRQVDGEILIKFHNSTDTFWGNFYRHNNMIYPHNKGKVSNSRGEIIEEGEYSQGRFINGTSDRLKFTNGQSYKGHVRNSVPNGQGELFNSKGERIAVGVFRDGNIFTGQLFKYPVTVRSGNKLFTGNIENRQFDLNHGVLE